MAEVALTADERARLGDMLRDCPKPDRILKGTWARLRNPEAWSDVFRAEDIAAVIRAYPEAAQVIGFELVR